MSESNPAVFLSYASQDAGAAKRICDALRARNIEVWFDQSELRGGDVWDQKIRQQIRDCALFIPIVSANTASRPEGYFRLEWDLADQRTHKMSRSRPFIVPVCLDATTDANADVPDSFLRVQWSRLPAGETPPSFADRVSDLLAAKQPAPAAPQASGGPAIASAIPRKGAVSSRWKPAALVIAVLALVLGFYVLNQRRAAGPVSAQSTPREKTGPNPGAAISAAVNATAPDAIPLQSIAVLPFVNMSPDKDQEYFSDGLSEELIGQLSRIPDLRVPARTSSFYFKGRSDDIAAIASKLRVAHVLEGSVRKAGNRLRVTAELIRADNGYHLWSETYDRELKDVFKVQTDIASAVVAALRLKLASVQPVSSQRTQDTEAHNFYLLGRQFGRGTSPNELKRAIDALHKAIALDPNYAGAYAELSVTELNLADSTSDETGFSRARAAAEKAIALAPQQAEGYSARGRLRIVRDWDWAGAQADLDKALALNPIDPTALRRHASLLATQGRLPESIAMLRKAVEIDPLSAMSWQNLGQFLMAHGEFAAADEATGRSLEIDPNSFYAQNDLGTLRLHQQKPAEALAVFTKVDDELFRDIGIAMSQHSLGHAAESQKFLDAATAANAQVGAYQIAQAHAWRGEILQALDWLDRAYQQRDGGLPVIKYDGLMDPLRGEPRFHTLLRKLKLQE